MLELALAILTTFAVFGLLTFGPLRRSETWAATVTPLASIIGSGFLICGPLLAKEFGLAAGGAMAVLLLIAYLIGSVIRFNIRRVEPYLAASHFHDPITWLARVGQLVLAGAYAVSVAYYLKLLAEFSLRSVVVSHALISNVTVTILLAALTAAAFTGGFRRVLHLAHATVTAKLAIIAGLLVALAAYWLMSASAPIVVATPKPSFHALALLFGLLITVQGFETSRYLGAEYSADLRVRTMRLAQWISSAIYLLFIVLLTPFLSRAAKTSGVAGILDIFEIIAPLLGIFVLIGAISSQLSAAVADSIGAAGLLAEVSRRRLGEKAAFVAAAILSIAIVWLTDPFEVVALSSRAFAVYYAIQCLLAIAVSIKLQREGVGAVLGFSTLRVAAVGVICVLAAFAGAPAE